MDDEKLQPRELQRHTTERRNREIAGRRRGGDRSDRLLDRAIRRCIRDHRDERRQRQEMDARWTETMKKLAAAQLITEEKMQQLQAKMDSWLDRRGGNGNQPPPAP